MTLVVKMSRVSTDRECSVDIIEEARKELDDITKIKFSEEAGLSELYGLMNRKLSSCLPRVYWWRDIKGGATRSRAGMFSTTRNDEGIIQRMIVLEQMYPIYLLDDLKDYKEAIRHIVLGEHVCILITFSF